MAVGPLPGQTLFANARLWSLPGAEDVEVVVLCCGDVGHPVSENGSVSRAASSYTWPFPLNGMEV